MRRHPLVLLVLLLGSVLMAVSCSDDDDSADESEATTTSAPVADADDGEGTDDGGAAPAETTTTAAPAAPAALTFTVEGVTGGANVPVEYTCDGANLLPPLTFTGVPGDVAELVVIVDDPDAPTESPFVHWIVYGIAPDTTVVTDGDPALTYGLTDAFTEAWFGPCPPPGDGLHAYRWNVYGLSAASGLEPGLDARQVEAAIADTTTTTAQLIASYARAG